MPVENLQGGWVDLENGVLHRKAPNEPETKKRAPGVPLGDKLWAHMRRRRRLTDRFVIEHRGRNITDRVFMACEGACELAGFTSLWVTRTASRRIP